MDVLIPVALGVICGTVTGVVPGLHVNTIAAVVAVLAAPGDAAAWFLVSVASVHTVVNILPATYLGAPDEDDVMAVLPAHRLLLAGRGADVIGTSVAASMLGALSAIFLGVALHGLLHGRLAPLLDAWTPWLLVTALVILWAQEWRRGLGGVLAAVFCSGCAAMLGWTSSQLTLNPWVPVAPTALLPLLGGLFGAAGLTVAWQRPPAVPWQPDARTVPRRTGPAILGATVAAGTALLPGLSASVATAMVPGIHGRPLHAVAAMSAINTAHTMLAVLVWMSAGRIRSGLADALQQWMPTTWIGWALPSNGYGILAVMATGVVLGAMVTLWLDHRIRRRVHQLPTRSLAMAGLAILSSLVLLLTGGMGMLLFVAAVFVGRLPLRLGVRRVHLVASLIVPVLIWTWN